MAGIYLGSTPIASLKLGASAVQSVYLGATKLWPTITKIAGSGPPATISGQWAANDASITLSNNAAGIQATKNSSINPALGMNTAPSLAVTIGSTYRLVLSIGTITSASNSALVALSGATTQSQSRTAGQTFTSTDFVASTALLEINVSTTAAFVGDHVTITAWALYLVA